MGRIVEGVDKALEGSGVDEALESRGVGKALGGRGAFGGIDPIFTELAGFLIYLSLSIK